MSKHEELQREHRNLIQMFNEAQELILKVLIPLAQVTPKQQKELYRMNVAILRRGICRLEAN